MDSTPKQAAQHPQAKKQKGASYLEVPQKPQGQQHHEQDQQHRSHGVGDIRRARLPPGPPLHVRRLGGLLLPGLSSPVHLAGVITLAGADAGGGLRPWRLMLVAALRCWEGRARVQGCPLLRGGSCHRGRRWCWCRLSSHEPIRAHTRVWAGSRGEGRESSLLGEREESFDQIGQDGKGVRCR